MCSLFASLLNVIAFNHKSFNECSPGDNRNNSIAAYDNYILFTSHGFYYMVKKNLGAQKTGLSGCIANLTIPLWYPLQIQVRTYRVLYLFFMCHFSEFAHLP